MATEALATDQTAERHIEGVKVTNDIKNADQQGSSWSMDVEGKEEEEKLKVEDSVGTGASVPEPEEKPKVDKSDATVEEVKKEEAAEAKASAAEIIASDAAEKEVVTKQESDPSSAVEPAAEVAEKEMENQPAVTETPESSKESVEKPSEVLESLVQASRSEVAEGPTDSEAVTKELKTTELPEFSSVSEIEGKTVETPIVSSITEPEASVITTKELLVSPESSKEGPDVTDSSKPEETSEEVQEPVVCESSDAVVVEPTAGDEIKDIVERVVPEDIPVVQEKIEADLNTEKCVKEENGSGAVDTRLATEPAEGLVKQECKVEEENQGKAMVVEKPGISEPTKTDAAATEVAIVICAGSEEVEKVEKESGSQEGIVETSRDLDASAEVVQVLSEEEKAYGGVEVVEEKDGSSEGDNIKVVETARDFDVEGGKNDSNASTENINESSGDNREDTGKTDEQNLVEPAKDGSEGPKEEAPAKPSQRQSHGIMSKVKQSLVKVKKAIIGKSPSSKTMTAENKGDIKA